MDNLSTINRPVALEDMSKEQFIAEIIEAQDDYRSVRYINNEDFNIYAEGL